MESWWRRARRADRAARPRDQSGADPAIAAFIEKIRAVDNHAHAMNTVVTPTLEVPRMTPALVAAREAGQKLQRDLGASFHRHQPAIDDCAHRLAVEELGDAVRLAARADVENFVGTEAGARREGQ